MSKLIIGLVATFSITLNCIAQGNCFKDFNEYKTNTPSLTFNFQLKKRTMGDVFMIGGIINYRPKKIIPASASEKIEKEIWGLIVSDTVYINSYPYSKIKGFNKILGKGFYSYFIGEPARTKIEQLKLGIIKPNENQKSVCCQTGYVILNDGTVKHLSPEILIELVQDNDIILNEVRSSNLKIEDVDKMFKILGKYNLSK